MRFSSSCITLLSMFALVTSSPSSSSVITAKSKMKKNIKGSSSSLSSSNPRHLRRQQQRRVLKGGDNPTDNNDDLPTFNCSDLISSLTNGGIVEGHVFVENGTDCNPGSFTPDEPLTISGSINVGVGASIDFTNVHVMGDIIVENDAGSIDTQGCNIDRTILVTPGVSIESLKIVGGDLGGDIIVDNVTINSGINFRPDRQAGRVQMENINLSGSDFYMLVESSTRDEATIKHITNANHIVVS